MNREDFRSLAQKLEQRARIAERKLNIAELALERISKTGSSWAEYLADNALEEIERVDASHIDIIAEEEFFKSL